MLTESRFAITPEKMTANVVAANQRAERLARRIGAARRAVTAGRPREIVLALLDGAEDER